MPVFLEPGRRPNESQGLLALAGNRAAWIRIAVKDDDFRALRLNRRAKPGYRPGPDTAVLVARTPLLRPKLQLAHFVHLDGQKVLFIAEILFGIVRVTAKAIDNLGKFADVVQVDRRVANPAFWTQLIEDDRKLRIVLDEAIDVVDNDYVDIEEQRPSCQIGQLVVPGSQFLPLVPIPVRRVLWQAQVRHRLDFDLLTDARRVVGETDKAE